MTGTQASCVLRRAAQQTKEMICKIFVMVSSEAAVVSRYKILNGRPVVAVKADRAGKSYVTSHGVDAEWD